jgi:hypothetical protein
MQLIEMFLCKSFKEDVVFTFYRILITLTGVTSRKFCASTLEIPLVYVMHCRKRNCCSVLISGGMGMPCEKHVCLRLSFPSIPPQRSVVTYMRALVPVSG